jgi:molybdopterin converting factor small subunit
MMLLKNNQKVDFFEKLFDGDHLVLFQPVGGG